MQMAYFHYNQLGPEDLQAAAFDWLNQGFYSEAIDAFQRMILRWNRCNDILRNLGKLRRGLAQAFYCINKSQDALHEIQLCISERYHEHSKVSV